jgi:hypothetical protein
MIDMVLGIVEWLMLMYELHGLAWLILLCGIELSYIIYL